MSKRRNDRPVEGSEPSSISDADDNRRSRSSLKDERVKNENALAELIDTLLKVSEAKWALLGVPEEAQDALRDLARITDPSAHARHKKFTRGMLRDIDWPALSLRVEQLRSGRDMRDPTGELPTHVELAHSLVIQGERGLGRFLEEHPHANRTRIRQLIKNVENAGESKRPRARAVLEQAVLDAIRTPASESDPPLP
jgi:ribosome-associated protein